jgi:hypothetical protein
VHDEQRRSQDATSIAITDTRRRPALAPLPPTRALSAAMPVMVNVKTVAVRSSAASRRAVAFCAPMEVASTCARRRKTWFLQEGGDLGPDGFLRPEHEVAASVYAEQAGAGGCARGLRAASQEAPGSSAV